MIYSYNQNLYDDQYTYLNILYKGWNHGTASVFILHPTHINKSIEMGKGNSNTPSCQWKVDSILEDYQGKDGFFIVFLLKNKK